MIFQDAPSAASRFGQPIDFMELESHRLRNLANSMTLAITEGFGDYVDTREWQQDDPTFGFGRVGSPILYTSLNDRDDGKYLPIFQTSMDLQAIRAEARNVTAMSGGIMGAIGTLSNYTLGVGFKFTVQKAPRCPESIPQEVVDAFIKEAQSIIDQCLLENKFQSDMDREIDWRTREDGEAFVELCVSPAGQIRLSFDEPDMICQPSNPGEIEDWLRDLDYARYSPEWTWSWSFGIHNVRRTPDDPQGYHVVYDTTGDDWEYMPASRMLHVKRNVPRNVKRGVSDLYWIANDVQREAKIRRNTADGAALQAAIAWFREHASGTTSAAVQNMVSGQAVDTRQQRTTTGTRPTKRGTLRSGTVVDIPETMKVLPGPMGSERNANFIMIAQYVARAIAQRWAMPEFMFTSDASNANYASTLVAESPFVKARETDQRFYSQAFVELMWKVLRLAHEIGRAFQSVQKFDELMQILEITAVGPRVSNRDENLTVARQQIEIDRGTLSLETAAAEMGRDLAKEQLKGAKPKDPNAAQVAPGDALVGGEQAASVAPGGELLGLNMQQMARVEKKAQQWADAVKAGTMKESVARAMMDGLGLSPEKINAWLDADPANDPVANLEWAIDLPSDAKPKTVYLIPLSQVRGVDPETIAMPIEDPASVPPIIVNKFGAIIDGRHRTTGLRRGNQSEVRAIIADDYDLEIAESLGGLNDWGSATEQGWIDWMLARTKLSPTLIEEAELDTEVVPKKTPARDVPKGLPTQDDVLSEASAMIDKLCDELETALANKASIATIAAIEKQIETVTGMSAIASNVIGRMTAFKPNLQDGNAAKDAPVEPLAAVVTPTEEATDGPAA